MNELLITLNLRVQWTCRLCVNLWGDFISAFCFTRSNGTGEVGYESLMRWACQEDFRYIRACPKGQWPRVASTPRAELKNSLVVFSTCRFSVQLSKPLVIYYKGTWAQNRCCGDDIASFRFCEKNFRRQRSRMNSTMTAVFIVRGNFTGPVLQNSN